MNSFTALKMPWPLLLITWLWALPVTLIGVVVGCFYAPQSVAWVDGCLEVQCGRSTSEGQTWGRIILLSFPPNTPQERIVGVRTHEHVHVLQTAVLGFFFLPLYLLAGLYALARGGHFHDDNAFEKMAFQYTDVR